MSYRDYQNTRNASWKILLDCGIDSLPVNINAICRRLGVRVFSYDEGAEIIERAHLYRIVRHANGVAFYLHNTPVILFDETRDKHSIRFTAAHELGHIVLGHVKPAEATVVHRGPEWSVVPEEKAANQFAVRMLAPACVLWGLDIHTPEEIMELCQITRSAAEYRAKRMAVLYQRQKFLTSSLEQELYRQFQPFITESGRPSLG